MGNFINICKEAFIITRPIILSINPGKIYPLLLSLTALIIFSGCSTLDTNSEEAKPVPVKSSWTALSSDQAATFDNGWLKDFDDNNLRNLVKEAIAYNYDLRAAAARLEQARYQTTIVGADRWPQASISTGGSRRRTNFIGFPFEGGGGGGVISSRSESFELLLNLSWEIDLWGRLKNQRQAAVADWEAAEAEYKAARLSLAAETVKAWFDVVEAHLQVTLAQEITESFNKNVEIIEKRYANGLSDALDLRLARSDEASARATLAARQADKDERIRRLEILLGRYPSQILEVTDTLPSLRQKIPAGLPSELLRRRPDIIVIEKQLESSGQRLSAARKAFLPSVNLTGNAGTESEDLKDLLNNNFSVWSIAGNLAQPVFQGRRLVAAAKQAREVQIERLAQYGETVLQAFREVETALAAERFLQERKESLSVAREEAMASERLAWDQYRRGLVDIITVLETERRAFDARSQYLESLNLQLQNRVNLHLALGGDFD